jgi:serine/threonine-protein kinase
VALLAAATPVILQRNGARSTQYALAVFTAGWVRYLLGEFDAAVPLLREALELFQSSVGERDNDRLPVLRVDLAMALIDAGQAGPEARTLLEAVVAARTAAHRDTSELAYARLPLARWFVAHREYDQATTLLDLVEAVGDRIEPEMHARVASTRAQVLRARHDDAGALEQDRRAYELTLRDVGSEHPRTARLALAYAGALRAAGRGAEAQALERTAAPIVEQAYPATSAYRRTASRD